MNIKNFFKSLGKGVLTVADKADGVPVLSQIDQVADVIAAAKVRTKSDKEKIETALHGLKELKITLGKRGTWERTRLKAVMLNGVAVALIYAGFDEASADQIALLITGPTMAYILGETWRPSKK